ncbi:MAG TPA: sulfate reduction electron transfer complex DsrMKJOP subunit DsrM [Desulfatiglandales bacterium]|nr:sulfate reduction electron transfer complex DsrMKJOP subunit DsrM [Desulfatiglandales bacterium]
MSFNFTFSVSLFLVIALVCVPLVGAEAGLQALFGIVIPYLALLVFLIGIVYRIIKWARTPVPYRIPTTAGQQKTLPWIKSDYLDNPHNTWGVIGRMALEVLFFRSLFRNLKTELREAPDYPEKGRLVYWSSKWLWIGAIAFHYSFLTVLTRHLKFFTEPVPFFVTMLEGVDGFLEIYTPAVYMSGLVLLLALAYLLARRIFDSKIRYISLVSDYFPLFLILGIGISGVLMRYFIKVDIIAVKELAMGLVTLHPKIPEGIGSIFYIHLFLVSTLLVCFPFSKLMHMPGVFFSMTRNMANNNRAVRHVNPWEYPVKVFSYMEQEDMFRKQMKKAGIPLERDIEE